MSNTLSIDQSFTCTGVCVFSEDGQMRHFECIKTDKSRSTIERASFISDRLLKIYNDYDCKNVVTESLAFGSIGNATRDLAGLLLVISVKFFEQHGFAEMDMVTPTSVKKFATGSGKAKKKDMMDALPQTVYDQFYDAGYLRSKGLADLADAYFIYRFWDDKRQAEKNASA